MKRQLWATLGFFGLLVLVPACFSYSWDSTGGRSWSIGGQGAVGLWVLANISYAGMRAQNHPSDGWRILAFIFGFPGTLVSFLAVLEGSCRAYGITLPRPTWGSSDTGGWRAPPANPPDPTDPEKGE